MSAKRILCVEDNEEILLRNRQVLEKSGYDVVAAKTLAEARSAVAGSSPDLIVLDILLPDGNGLDFLQDLRKTSGVPVLLLTGLSTEENVINGLTQGGDDYLPKPYSFAVLLARVDALLRRSAHVPEALARGSLKLDIVSGQAFLAETDMLLTQKEFALLLILMRNEDKPVCAAHLYEKAWKTTMNDDERAVRYHISNLRKKLCGSGFTIVSHRNEGYVFEKE